MRNFFLIICLVLGGISLLSAQTDPEALQNQIESLGLDEEEVMARLEDKGIDIETIGPEDVDEVQAALEEVIAEMTAEKAAQSGASPAAAEAAGNAAGGAVNDAVEAQKSAASDSTPQATSPSTDTLMSGDDVVASMADSLTDLPKDELPPPNIYGQSIFREEGATVDVDALNVKPPPSYVLGPGDEVAISVFGASQASFNFQINGQGYIQPPGMGRIYLKGITLASAQDLLASRFGQYYSFGPGQFEVAVSYARVVTVNIVGEVFNPGSVNVLASNTIFNALVAAGGPNEIGSLRRIKLIREGEEPRIFDVYEFLNNPQVENQFYLQENDYIHVPVNRKVVSISGAVRRPMQYELTSDENLIDLVELAGGLEDNAYLKSVQITRIADDQQQIIDVNLRELIDQGSDFELKGADNIVISKIAKPYENFVEISGEIEFPGKYQLTNGMRVIDLVNKGNLEVESRRDIAYVFRTSADQTVELLAVDLESILEDPNSDANFELQPKDQIRIFSKVTFVDKAKLSTTGAVRQPIEIPYDPNADVTVWDMVLLSGGLEQNAAEFGYLKRTDPANAKNVDYIRVNVFNVVADSSSLDNIALRPNDQLIVYTNEQFYDEALVQVSGAVREPGAFDYDENLRVTDAIYFAEGLKQEAAEVAYLYRTNLQTKETEYIRIDLAEVMENPASAQNVMLEPLDELVVLTKTDFIDETEVQVSGSVRKPGTYKFNESLTLKDALTLAGGLKLGAARNRVEVSRVLIRNNQPTQTVVAIVEVDENLETVNGGDGAAFQLQPFDQIIVRNVPEFKMQENITLEGELNYPGTHPLLSDNERLSSLIERAGGLTDEAFAEGATLFRSEDGVGFIIMDLESALKKKGSRFDYILKPGDIISIPDKKDFVTVEGETKANELYQDEIIASGKIVVPHHKGKRARYYVRKYAAGVGEDGKASKITVQHPNGEVKKTLNFGLFLIHPKVRKGSVVTVGKKPVEPVDETTPSEKEDIDWGAVVADSIAQATAILSLILLIQNVNK
ncbi:MAG: hypothetical protein GYB31_17660 [Bacteroidetes bacterium]|nr:hypothetical protein [Bacteroidota bacterium]